MTPARPGRGAGPRRPALLALLPVAALVLSSCAVGAGADDAPARRPERLSAEAKVAERNRQADPVGVSKQPRQESRRARAPRGPAAASGAAASAAPGAAGRPDRPPRHRWSGVVATTDAAADHGRGPTYADLRGLALDERAGKLRISVTLDGVAPARLADREVQGIGVDFFTHGGEESDHQVFLDGGDHGWRGYLQGPDGFVRFPGTIRLDGAVLTVTLPWESVGGRRGTVSAFVDWSAGTSMLATDGTDRLPL